MITMITRNIALLGLALFAASCTTMGDFHPLHRQPSASSMLPLVCISNAPAIPFVNASVNGRQGLFIVDTGAGVTVIDTSFAKALGLETRPLGGWRVHSNVSGGLKIAWVDTLTVGNDVFEKFAVAVIGLTHLSQSLGQQIDGIIGLNVLSVTGCQIDPQRGRLSLHPSGPVGHPVPIILEHGVCS